MTDSISQPLAVDRIESLRPVVMGTRHMAVAGHYGAAHAAFAVLEGGGNAVDAGVAAGIALGVLQSDLVNVAGVAPIIVYRADTREVQTISGLGTWPRAITPGYFVERHGGAIPHGVLRTVVPAAPDAWITALEQFGTMSFSDCAAAAIRFASDGFPMYGLMAEMIGFSTCVTRTIQMTNSLRTSAGSHERLLVLEVFGRYAGFTAMLPTMAGAAHRCVIPEYEFDIEQLTSLLVEDRNHNPSKYSVVLVSEGAMFKGGQMIFADSERDAYGHAKLGGIGDLVSEKLKEISGKFNNGKTINVINQKLGYMVRGGDPDALDSIVPMAYGNLALDLILRGVHGRIVVLKNGRYDNLPIDVVTSSKKIVRLADYNTERLRPHYHSFEMKPFLLMASDN
jgi:hypothetical protein